MTTRKPRTTRTPAKTDASANQIIAELKAQLEAAKPEVEPEPVIDMASVVADLQKQLAALKEERPAPAITPVEPQVIAAQPTIQLPNPTVVERKGSFLPKANESLKTIPFGTISAWIAAFVGVFLWWQGQQPKTDSDADSKPKATISAVLEKAYEADRKSRISTLRELETKSFKSDQEKLDWINSETETKRQIDFREYIDRMAEAVFAGQTGKMANDLEAGK